MKNKKQKVINYLFSKLDTLKLEIFNIQKHKNEFMLLYDFEKDSRLVEHEHKLIVRNRKEKVKEQNIINEVKRYLMEVKLIPINKILCQAHKVIFYDEYIYLIKEYEINKNNFIKEGKRNKLINNIDCNIVKGDNIEKDDNIEKGDSNIERSNIVKDDNIERSNIVKDDNIERSNIVKGDNSNIVKDDNSNTTVNNYSNINNININNINNINNSNINYSNIDNIKINNINYSNINYSNINYSNIDNIKINSININNININYSNNIYHKELITYFKLKEMFLTTNINLMPKNTTNTFLFLERNDSSNLLENQDHPSLSLKSYKDKISIFKECHSKSSKFYKFTKALHMTGCHQSFRKINEKFVFSNLRDLTRNINKLTDYQNNNVVYNQENNRTQNDDNLEDETYENFYQTEMQENNEGLEKYPFYGGQ